MVDGDFSRDVHQESPLAIGVSTEDYLHLRGFDERPTLSGALFMDFVARMRRAGWICDTHHLAEMIDVAALLPGLRLDPDETSQRVRERRREQVRVDGSIYRNLTVWAVPPEKRPTLVSVPIATRDRADYLKESLLSVLAQDFQEFEIVVVDDGSDDHTREVVEGIDDVRITYIRQDAKGISAARNRAADASVGHYTAVHDDDDIMLPWRLSTGLAALDGSHEATYGSWVNFDDETAQLQLHLTPVGFGRDLIAHNGQTPGHATWILPTRMVQELRYDESLSSSIDHNLAIRSVLSGLRWRHTQRVLYLRRVHKQQVSQTDGRRQRSTAILTRMNSTFSASFAGRKQMATRGKELSYPQHLRKDTLFAEYGAYLPDRLVVRSARINGLVGKKILAMDLHDKLDLIASDMDLDTDRPLAEAGGVGRIQWDDMVDIRAAGILGVSYEASQRSELTRDPEATDPRAWLQGRLGKALRDVKAAHPAGALLVLTAEGDLPWLQLDGRPEEHPVVLRRSMSVNFEENGRLSVLVLGVRHPRDAMPLLREAVERGVPSEVIAVSGASTRLFESYQQRGSDAM
ncbi:glycosyltransferase family 2 protein [Ornithinimicrobium faecis]|uniref:glycosyltransferase family 2 protein n=1 Tax=Ornithinimicrobium faecis TaxID=2934158 RepID=UPI002119A70E